MLWTFEDLCALFGRSAVGTGIAPGCTGVAIDSRAVVSGTLFFALSGTSQDGHQYVTQALKSGAAGAVVSRLDPDYPRDRVIVVQDTYRALYDLAGAARARCAGVIIGVTGSFGKTTSKEMLRAVVTTQGKAYANIKSYNNYTGVPLSVAHLERDTQFGLFEMGMNHAGEIIPLSKVSRPHIALITAIGPAHIENLGSLENIAKAKAEIFAGLEPNSYAIVNGDTLELPTLVAEAKRYGVPHFYTFGQQQSHHAYVLDAVSAPEYTDIEAMVLGTRLRYRLGVPGHHQIGNSLGVLLAAKVAGVAIEHAAMALETMTAVAGRGQIHKVMWQDGEVIVIDETYNANPVSMAAALRLLDSMPTRGRRIAIVGDMRELGPDSLVYHRSLESVIGDTSIDLVITCGMFMSELSQVLPDAQRGPHAETSAELVPLVPQLVVPGDVIMIKGSRGMQMEKILAPFLRH